MCPAFNDFFFTARQRSCGKAMFSLVSVYSFGGGVHVTSACDAIGQLQVPWDSTWPQTPTPT